MIFDEVFNIFFLNLVVVENLHKIFVETNTIERHGNWTNNIRNETNNL